MKHLKYIGNSVKLFLMNINILKSSPKLTQKEIRYLRDLSNGNLMYDFEPIFDYIKSHLSINQTKSLLVKNPELLEIFI